MNSEDHIRAGTWDDDDYQLISPEASRDTASAAFPFESVDDEMDDEATSAEDVRSPAFARNVFERRRCSSLFRCRAARFPREPLAGGTRCSQDAPRPHRENPNSLLLPPPPASRLPNSR